MATQLVERKRRQRPTRMTPKMALLCAIMFNAVNSTNAFSIPPMTTRMTRRSSLVKQGSIISQQQRHHQHPERPRNTLSQLAASTDYDGDPAQELDNSKTFDLSTALFCGGLAFDAYAEPPPNSSRWEKGVRLVACNDTTHRLPSILSKSLTAACRLSLHLHTSPEVSMWPSNHCPTRALSTKDS
mmetsp:Transcript_24965/g.37249  ORF Transcript_24965/g.37249 Transcript_24965/m.37249 type:complete len:185 (+) Transcript_24965:13-567(+)